MLENFFSDSCLPGALNAFYERTFNNSESLCKLCKTEWVPYKRAMEALGDQDESGDEEEKDTEVRNMVPSTKVPPNFERFNCEAATANRFYGNKGALACLSEVGDVAVVEIQKLEEHAKNLNLNPHDFRIICRNNTPAEYTGFDVDYPCRLTTIIDGEVMVKGNSKKNPGIVNALSSLDTYLQRDPDFKMYNVYRGNLKNLLFEDSSLGLVSPNSTSLGRSVLNYIELFKNMDNCHGLGVQSVANNFLLTLTLLLVAVFLGI